MRPHNPPPLPDDLPGVLTVSALNAQIKGLMESAFPYVWVRGEISNFRVPASGHFYFTLKDEESQIRAVFFRGQNRHMRFVPDSGLLVLCQGRVSVYEPRGEYQLIVEVMEPQGLGALQLAFEQLKKRLEAEGLFDPARKRPISACPQRIAVVTSPTGAAVRDILKVLGRSPYPLTVTLFPVRVQGTGAAAEIAAAIATANALRDEYGWDVLLVGRGGGSLEDLWPFNEEVVARALAASAIPTISAVGHEIDVTIADFTSDFRAPTPTAAADWIVSRLEHFQRDLNAHGDRLLTTFDRILERHDQRLQSLRQRLIDPRKRLADWRLYVDDRLDRLALAWHRRLERERARLSHLGEKLRLSDPLKQIGQQKTLLAQCTRELFLHHHKVLDRHRFQLQKYASRLEGLSPLNVLARGYSITTLLPQGTIVRRASDVAVDRQVRVRLAQGHLDCLVQKVEEPPASGGAGKGDERKDNRGQKEG